MHRRGLAGTVLVHKAAGAAAEAGHSLEQVKQTAELAINNVWSFGVALSVCSVPGAERNKRLDGELCEIGLGIHGEPGVLQTQLMSSHDIATACVEGIQAQADWLDQTPVYVCVNNLGATSVLELNAFALNVYRAVVTAQLKPVRLLVGTLMTSLDMKGVSVTLMNTEATGSGIDL